MFYENTPKDVEVTLLFVLWCDILNYACCPEGIKTHITLNLERVLLIFITNPKNCISFRIPYLLYSTYFLSLHHITLNMNINVIINMNIKNESRAILLGISD
jgi:hypothetical protein